MSKENDKLEVTSMVVIFRFFSLYKLSTCKMLNGIIVVASIIFSYSSVISWWVGMQDI
jgi:hypothetical protein